MSGSRSRIFTTEGTENTQSGGGLLCSGSAPFPLWLPSVSVSLVPSVVKSVWSMRWPA